MKRETRAASQAVRGLDLQRRRLIGLSGALALGAWAPLRKAIAAGAQEHSHHHREAAPGPQDALRSESMIRIPELTLQRQDGARVAFPKELDAGGMPVLLTFIFTSCTTVCPVMSQVFSDVQGALGEDLNRVKLVSISIDPEYDTPERLTEYAKKFGATPHWQHYTGTVAATQAMQKAFNSYFGDKMSHRPVAFARARPGSLWVRYDGFVSPATLVQEYRSLALKA